MTKSIIYIIYTYSSKTNRTNIFEAYEDKLNALTRVEELNDLYLKTNHPKTAFWIELPIQDSLIINTK